MNRYLDVAPEVQEAIKAGKPVVALESTIISHGMPYPQNVETALNVEKIIREGGAVPATIAIIGGRLKAGLTPEEIDYLGKTGAGVTKASRRDLPILVAEKRDGATTVTTTMMIAAMAGIEIFATGGIGGVHRGAETTMDISADLEELAQTPVMVVCAGAKSILDLGLTLEYLETHGVPVIGYQTEELPAFYTRKSGFGVDYRLDPRPAGRGVPCQARAGPAGRHAGDESHPGGVLHGRGRDQQGHRRGGGGGQGAGHPRQGHHPLPAGQDQGHHRRRQSGRQYPAGVQQRAAGHGHSGGAEQAAEGRLTVGELLTTPAGALAVWLIAINLVTFAVYGADKRRARRGAWRVPEKTLFLLPLLGGSVGALLGMRVFRHKTKHWYFVWGVPAILLAQLALAVWLLYR